VRPQGSPRHVPRAGFAWVAILAVLVTWASLAPTCAWAQRATLSGTVATSAGTGVPGAVVSVTPAPSGPRTEVRADSSGRYVVPNLAAGAYGMTVSADGYDTTTLAVTLAADETKTVNVTLAATLSLGELGFSAAQTQGSAADQARLNRRSRMLRIHQELGLVTAASFVATLLSSAGAGGRTTSAGGRDLHAGLGVLTIGLYATTASYAIRAPKIPGTHTRGPIRLHKALAWIHGTGMILTPVLGALAFDERSRGERVQGLASAHGAVAAITAAAYGAAMLSIAVKF
jgi:hypothetical protein